MQTILYWRLSAYYFFYYAFVGCFMPYFGLYLESLSFSAWSIGLAMSQMQLMRVFGPYFWGRLVDRTGKRLLIIRMTAIIGLLGFSLLFVVNTPHIIVAILAVQSFFWVAALPLLETLTFDHLHDRLTGYGRIRIWGSIGFILAVPVIGVILDYAGIRSLLWILVFLLFGILVVGFFLTEAPRHAVPSETPPMLDILGIPRVFALLFSGFFMTSAHSALNIFFAIFLSAYGYDKFAVGLFIAIGVLVEIGVFFFSSSIMRRFTLRQLLITSFVAAMIRFSLIGFGVETLWLLVIAQTLHGLTFAVFHASAVAAIARWFPGNTRARGQALYSSFGFGAGGLFGGLLCGALWERIGGAFSFALGSVFAAIGLLFVVIWVREET